MAGNPSIEKDAADNWKPSKKRSPERIDDIVALVMSWTGRAAKITGRSASTITAGRWWFEEEGFYRQHSWLFAEHVTSEYCVPTGGIVDERKLLAAALHSMIGGSECDGSMQSAGRNLPNFEIGEPNH